MCPDIAVSCRARIACNVRSSIERKIFLVARYMRELLLSCLRMQFFNACVTAHCHIAHRDGPIVVLQSQLSLLLMLVLLQMCFVLMQCEMLFTIAKLVASCGGRRG
jgi:hypothetical protein